MSDPQDLGQLKRWGEGGAVVILVSVATAGVPLATVLMGDRAWVWYAAPFLSGFLVLLALTIDLRSRRRAQGRHLARIQPDVVEAARQRFTVPVEPEAARAPADGVRQDAGEEVHCCWLTDARPGKG